MNANSKQPAPATIKQWLTGATDQLNKAGIPSAKLDAELILSDALGRERSWLIAHSDDQTDFAKANVTLARRLAREPLAYIRGYKEFYGRDFTVTPDSLIPRPETETLVEAVLALPLGHEPLIHDVGTGSGCIPITLALELPSAQVTGSDISHAALELARRNAEKLNATNVGFYKDDLLSRSTGRYHVITANLPYVDPSWETSPETASEPSLALFTTDSGLKLIKQLIEQAPAHLLPSGYLVLEADPRQHADIIAFATHHGLSRVATKDFIVTLQKS